jgi:hypothetical protein
VCIDYGTENVGQGPTKGCRATEEEEEEELILQYLDNLNHRGLMC